MRKPSIVVAMLVIALTLIASAGARGVGGPHARQGDCGPASGTPPTVQSVTVDGVSVAAGSNQSGPGMGKLYYSTEVGNGQQNGSYCLYPFTIRLNRDYTGASPSNGQWSPVWGVASYFLDHATLAQKFNPAYADQPAVTSASTIVITLALTGDGVYSAPNAYWFTSTGKLEGNTGIQISGTTMTVTGHPAPNLNAPETWPTGLDPAFNAYTASASGYDLANWPGGTPNGYNAMMNPPVQGAAIAPAASMGLQFSFNARFSNGAMNQGSEAQRGSWFEAVNSPRWTNNFSNQGGSPQLQLGMGNYHSYYDSANTETVDSGSLRMLLPDAWASLAFGVTSASDPALIQGAIQVIRTESGTTTPITAITTPVAGQGIIVDVGTVTFSEPNFTTKKSMAVRASVRGKKVALRFVATKDQLKASKNKVVIWGGSKKLKKLTTITAKVGSNSVTVKNIGKGGYVVKAGKTIIGSATLGQSGGGGNTGGGGNKGNGGCMKQNCSNGGK
ncbi:MAG: hypothetical protein ACR2JV_05485 [Gaiellales bacterium]